MEGRRVMLVARWLAGALLAAVAAIGCALLTGDLASADEPTTGSITIVLDASPDDGQDFTFTGCQGPWCGEFSLDDDADPTRANTTTAEVEPGTYTITQHAVANWTLSSLACDTGETVSLADRRATIDLSAGEDVICTFTTTSASITIIQDSNPQDGHDFTYTGCLGAGCSTVALDDDLDPTLPDRVTAAGLAPGTYVVTHATDANWALTSISCTTGESVSLANRRVTITLIAGEQTTCTFKDRGASITVVQDTSPDDGQDFDYTGCLGTGCADFVLDNDADATRPSTTSAGALAAGTYTVTQVAVADWPLTSITCTTGESVSLANRRVTITLGAGEQTSCTFKNTSATLTLVEDTTPDGPQDFTLKRCNGETCVDITLDDDLDDDLPNSTGAVPLAPGTYTVTADAVAGHELASVTCATTEAVDLDARRVTITLGAAEQQTCTFIHRTPQPPLTDVSQISTAVNTTCARLANGQARCWGYQESSGQLGDGGFSNSSVPVMVLDPAGAGPLTGVEMVDTSFTHACAVLDSGQARCWGDATVSALGDGTSTTSQVRPVVVSNPAGTGPLTGVASIAAAGQYSCALLDDGEARCWGGNASGALGDGTTVNRPRPVAVSNPTGTGPLTDISQISARLSHTCALLTSGQAACWGSNVSGQLGDGTNTNRTRPVTVTNADGTGPLTDILAISAGYTQTCALLESGEARCWGLNTHGQLGDGTTTNRNRPVVVSNPDGTAPLSDIVQIDAGGDQACALTESGSVYCWGRNTYGGVGDGTSTTRLRPVAVVDPAGTAALGDVTQISSSSSTSCARLADGQARCWGFNTTGGLGDGTSINRARPVVVIDPSVQLQPLSGVVQTTTGEGHTCALLSGGQARCWGGGSGLLGNPSVVTSMVAVPVLDEAGTAPLSGVTSLAAGVAHTCALLESGEARCWGKGGAGQLGDDTSDNTVLPVAVLDEDGTGPLTGIVQIDAGDDHTCAVLETGQARCWGDNFTGAIGDGTTSLRYLPTVVSDQTGTGPLTGVVSISAGLDRTCALLTSSQVRCWGAGRLGDGTATTRSYLPVVVTDPAGTGPLADVVGIEAGANTSCAVLADGQARCWGSLTGDGTGVARATPVVVTDPTGAGPLTDVARIQAGPTHTCAAQTTGQARCWSFSNFWGEVGVPPPTTPTLRPSVVLDPVDGGAMATLAGIGVGRFHSCAPRTSGTVRCWGWNGWGNLGDGTTSARYQPVTVVELFTP